MQRHDGTQPTFGREGEVDCAPIESSDALHHRKDIKMSMFGQ